MDVLRIDWNGQSLWLAAEEDLQGRPLAQLDVGESVMELDEDRAKRVHGWLGVWLADRRGGAPAPVEQVALDLDAAMGEPPPPPEVVAIVGRCAKGEITADEAIAELARFRGERPPDAAALGGFRADDPDTSRQGAIDAYPRTGTQRAKILAAIEGAGEHGLTWGEVEKATGIASCWKRISELVEGGWVKALDDETRVIEQTGSKGQVYVATGKARERREALTRERSIHV